MDLQDPFIILHRHVPDEFLAMVSCIVDQDVHTPLLLHNPVHQFLGTACIRDVKLIEYRSIPKSFQRFCRLFR